MNEHLQLFYSGFRAYHAPEIPVTNTTPIGNQSAAGRSGSKITVEIPTAFQPKSASLGCVSFTNPIVGLSIQCTIRVTAISSLDDVEYPTAVDVKYSGSGNLTKCDFPPEWKLASSLEFEITKFNASLVYSDETTPIYFPNYDVQFLFDDFSATYQCPEGGDAKTGLCVEGIDFRENELRK
jgi:hypothetical protein